MGKKFTNISAVLRAAFLKADVLTSLPIKSEVARAFVILKVTHLLFSASRRAFYNGGYSVCRQASRNDRSNFLNLISILSLTSLKFVFEIFFLNLCQSLSFPQGNLIRWISHPITVIKSRAINLKGQASVIWFFDMGFPSREDQNMIALIMPLFNIMYSIWNDIHCS